MYLFVEQKLQSPHTPWAGAVALWLPAIAASEPRGAQPEARLTRTEGGKTMQKGKLLNKGRGPSPNDIDLVNVAIA